MQQPYRERLREAKLNQLPEAIRGDTQAAVDTPADKRSEVQKYLAQKFETDVRGQSGGDRRRARPAGPQALQTQSDQELADSEVAARKSFGKIQCLFDVGPPPETHLLVRGNFVTPGPVVEPGFLTIALVARTTPTGWSRPCRLPIRQGAGPRWHVG